jgi:DNA polymerase-4
VFGPFAPLLRARARGEDPTPVLPLRRSPELAEDAVLSAEDNDDGPLLTELARLVEAVGARLRGAGRAAGRLALTVTYADGREEKASSDLPSPLEADIPLFSAAEELFRRACSRRVRVRRMRLSCPLPVPRALQLPLFEEGGKRARRAPDALQQALDRLRGQYGTEAVRWGRTV